MKSKLILALTLLAHTACNEGSDIGSARAIQAAGGSKTKLTTSARTTRPDLVVSSFTWSPASPAANDIVTFSAVVKNQGNRSTPSGTILGVGFRNGAGSTIAFSDTYTASLAAGGSVTLIGNKKWTATQGSHAITAIVDDVNRIAESNEANNTLGKTLTVSSTVPTLPNVDLVVTNFTYTPSAPIAGQTVSFTATVKNQGTTATPSGVTLGIGYLNAAGSNIAFSDTYSSSLAAGASVNLTTNKTWVAISGSQTITAFADDVNRIVESNESNNKLVQTFTVGGTLPPPTASNAKPAHTFVHSVGVNTHFGFPSTPYYTNYPAVRDRLLESGIKHIRDGGSGDFGKYLGGGITTMWNELAANGVKLLLIGRVVWSSSSLKSILTYNAAAIEATEGQNEGDLFVSGDWVSIVRSWQVMLWNTVKGNTATKNLPVLAPSTGRIYNYSTLGDLSAYSDNRNVHSYPGGVLPLNDFDTHVNNAMAVAGTKAVWATETGYHNAVATTNGHRPASERATGKYLPRLYFDYFNRGVERTYAYQFYDHIPHSSTNPEAEFGLVRYDMSVKPAFTNLKNTLAILNDSSASVPGGTLSYSLSGATSGVRTTLLQKTNGNFYLVVWRDVLVYDTTNRRDIINSDVNVTLSLGTSKAVSVFKPSTGTTAIANYSNTSAVNLSVPDEIIIVELRP